VLVPGLVAATGRALGVEDADPNGAAEQAPATRSAS